MNHVAAMNGWMPFVNMQCQYNVLYREEEREMLPCCRYQGIAVTTFSPLARGFLARDSGTARTAHDLYQEYFGDEIDREIRRRVGEVAARLGVSAAHVAMAWVAGSPNNNIRWRGAVGSSDRGWRNPNLNVRLLVDRDRSGPLSWVGSWFLHPSPAFAAEFVSVELAGYALLDAPPPRIAAIA